MASSSEPRCKRKQKKRKIKFQFNQKKTLLKKEVKPNLKNKKNT
jgi:hypothetical protein